MPRTNILLVFIHGFMGSHESFHSFPGDLAKRFFGSGLNLEVKVYPAYETASGNSGNKRQVQLLMDWLMLHASTAHYHQTFLLAHSMGGLLAADAIRYLYHLDVPASPKAESDSLTSKVISNISSFFSYDSLPKSHNADDMRFLVNVCGLISFDSPFFGLHRDVLFDTGIMKAKEVAMGLPEHIPALIPNSVSNLVPDKVQVPIAQNVSIPVSTAFIKERIISAVKNSKVEVSEKEAINPESMLGALNINHKKLETGNSLLVIMSELGYIAPVVVASKVGNAVVSAVQFLDPLLGTEAQCLDRILILTHEHHVKNRLYFRGYFNVLPCRKSTDTTKVLFVNPILSEKSRTFCIPPPLTQAKTMDFNLEKQFFTTLPTPLEDEIEAHMAMFDRQVLGGEHYNWLLDHVSKDIINGIAHLTS